MKLSIAESALVGCLLACAASAWLVILAIPLVGRIGTQVEGGMLGSPHLTLTVAAGLQIATVLVGLAVVLPRIRRIKQERGQLRSLTGELSQRSQHFEEAAHTDPLTGLKNRRFFDEALKQFLAEFALIERPVGLMVLDLDHFKAVNDTHGHDMGDEVLRAVAECLGQWTRHHDVVARLGGEEFAVIVPNLRDDALVSFANRIREALSRVVVSRGNVRLRITASVGLAVAAPGEESASVMKRADVMLYRAKQQGRNRVCA